MRNLAIVNFPGFACLFYGSPVTGKTETVLQLSRKTRRPIFQVNISDLKSKWVGESEKKIQGLFSKYEAMVKKYDICPILFFKRGRCYYQQTLK